MAYLNSFNYDGIVQFNKSLTLEQYNALSTEDKDAGTLYFITDTPLIYKGDVLFNRNYVAVTTLPATGVVGVLYALVDGDDIELYIWNTDEFKTFKEVVMSKAVNDVTWDSTTQTITFKFNDDTPDFPIDLVLEQVIKDFDYDSATQELVFTHVDGTETRVPVSEFIPVFTTDATNSTTVTIANNKITVDVKISTESGNAIEVKADGLYVDGSKYVEKVTGATDNIPVFNAGGAVIDSGKTFTTIIDEDSTDNQVATAKSTYDTVNALATEVNTAFAALIAAASWK